MTDVLCAGAAARDAASRRRVYHSSSTVTPDVDGVALQIPIFKANVVPQT
jgi:hypothetical protein